MDEDFDQAGETRAEAAEWFARLKSLPVSRETLEQFFAWRKIGANAAAFEEVERFWSAAGQAGDRPAILAATEDAYRREGEGRPRLRRGPLAAIVGFAVLVVAGTAAWLSAQGQHYETRVGERSIATLDDGSRVTLDTASAVHVRYTAGERRIELDHGQAYFEVAHNANRPFLVEADGMRVVATGTQFEVRRIDHATEVTLVDGSVRVEPYGATPRRLAPGEKLSVIGNAPPTVRSVDTAAEMAWRRGQLVLDGVTLAAAVAEINRYTQHPIKLDAARYAGSRFSGSFAAGDTASFAAAAAALLPVKVLRASDGSITLTDPTAIAQD